MQRRRRLVLVARDRPLRQPERVPARQRAALDSAGTSLLRLMDEELAEAEQVA